MKCENLFMPNFFLNQILLVLIKAWEAIENVQSNLEPADNISSEIDLFGVIFPTHV